MRRLAASLLGADPLNLERALEQTIDSGVDIVHIDVMDGHFVPNIAFGPDVVAALRRLTDATFDVHLMVSDFERHLDRYADAGADWLTIHLEAGLHHERHLRRIRELGLKAGVAVNPGTPVSLLEELTDAFDVLLVMSVNPGFSGAKFIDRSLAKVAAASELRTERSAHFLISVDGGVNEHNAANLSAAGADVLVAASALYGGTSIGERVEALGRAIERSGGKV